MTDIEQPAAPVKRRARWGLILAVVAIALVAVLAGTVTYVSSEAALRRLLAYAVEQSAGKLSVEEARGSLLGRMELARLVYRDGDATVTLEGVTIDHAPRSLIDRRLTIPNLSIRQLSVEIGPGDGSATSLPESLALPIDLTVEKATI